MEIYGLFGEKLSHSLSPKIFQILFEKYNIQGTYSAFEIKKENFENAVQSCKVLNIKGANVTIPYKEDVIAQLDEIDDCVKKIGACNCIKFLDGIATGYNTDYYGVLNAFNYNNIDVKNKDCVVLGAGGAAKSVITLLKDLGVKRITVVSRDVSDKVSDDIIKYIDYSSLDEVETSYLLINTTPIGMYPNIDESPVSKDFLEKFEICFDAVYNPLETKLLKEAKEIGLVTVDGLYMLVGQAINAFSIFNGISVDKDEFINIYNKVGGLE